MKILWLLFNENDRLRSGWRAALFAIAQFVLLFIVWFAGFAVLRGVLGAERSASFLAGGGGFAFQGLIILSVSLLVGWACARLFEDLPFKSLGLWFHRGWLRDLILGALLGGAALLLATVVAAAFGGYSIAFHFSEGAAWRTLVISGAIFLLGAAAEEAWFRGYALQTLTRSGQAAMGAVMTAICFALIHSNNPNVPRVFMLTNTTLAGLWLAIAYLRTRSLWFPLGLHWAWNWVMGSIIGLPVSGITELASQPLMNTDLRGAAWLTGGNYGLEGGIACTVALVLITFLIWRAPFLRADEEMKGLTGHERPKVVPQTINLNQNTETRGNETTDVHR